MHVVKDSNGTMTLPLCLKGRIQTHPASVKEMKEKMEKKNQDLKNDDEMEDAKEETSDDEDFDYDPDND
jgi:guanylate kinase